MRGRCMATLKGTPTPLEHGIGVQLIFDDKFGSVLKCIGLPKVAAGGGSGHGPPPSHSFICTCNLISELLHVLIINPNY